MKQNRQCRGCERFLPPSEFYPRNDGTLRTRCKNCENQVRRDRSKAKNIARKLQPRVRTTEYAALGEPAVGVLTKSPRPKDVELGRPWGKYELKPTSGITGRNRDQWGISLEDPDTGNKTFLPIATEEILGKDQWDVSKSGHRPDDYHAKTWYKVNPLVLRVWDECEDGQVVEIGPSDEDCDCGNPGCEGLRENPDVWTYWVWSSKSAYMKAGK